VFGFTRDDREHGFDGASWSIATGPRLQLLGPLYAQAQGGAAWVTDPPRGALRPIVDVELGLSGGIGCSSGGGLGAWLRIDPDRGEVTAGGLTLRFVMGAGMAATGGPIAGRCAGLSTPYLAHAPPPPPPPPAVYVAPPPEVRVPDVQAPEVHVDATVAVPMPQPIVIELDLGAQIAGIAVRLDPRIIPIDRLRGAGWIDIELSGSSDALATFQAQLAASLSRGGVRVDGWASVPTSSSVVHAKLTVWPPKTRPAPPPRD
jgi:hypothetical protein